MDEMPVPSKKVKALDRLVGKWEVSGGAEGVIEYRWMDGGFFLIQEVALTQFGNKMTGIEIIGHLHPFGEEPSVAVKSRYYDSMGNTLDYEYEINGDELTIWAGEKGSPAFFKGTFSKDGNTNTGKWTYPDGGGYDSVMKRIK